MKLIIAGNYGAHNLGDELILEGILTAIRRIKPAAEITILSEKPQETKNKYEVHCLKKFPAGFRSLFFRLLNGDFKKTSKAVKECDFFMFGGGGLFDGTTLKGMIIWAVQAAFAYRYKKPVILYAQSVSSIDSKLKRWIVKKVFGKAVFISVRDENSKEILKDIIKGKQVYIMPDMIFRIEDFKQTRTPNSQNKVLICLKKIEWMKEELKASIIEFANNLLRENMTVEFLPFAIEDEKYLNEIADKITQKEKIEIHRFTEDKNRISEIFQTADFVLGMRLHGVLMAIICGIPFIAINYNPKVENLLKSVGLEENLIEPEDVDSETLITRFLKRSERNTFQQICEDQLKKHLEVESHLKVLLD